MDINLEYVLLALPPILLVAQMIQSSYQKARETEPTCSFYVETSKEWTFPMVTIICHGGSQPTIFRRIKIKHCDISKAEFTYNAHGEHVPLPPKPDDWASFAKGPFFVNSEAFPEYAPGFGAVSTRFSFWIRPKRTLTIMVISLSIWVILRSITLKMPITKLDKMKSEIE